MEAKIVAVLIKIDYKAETDGNDIDNKQMCWPGATYNRVQETNSQMQIGYEMIIIIL